MKYEDGELKENSTCSILEHVHEGELNHEATISILETVQQEPVIRLL
jgi:hypothetical protein